jgi:hypothetical protein
MLMLRILVACGDNEDLNDDDEVVDLRKCSFRFFFPMGADMPNT